MDTSSESQLPPQAEPRTCSHEIGPDNLECVLCGHTILLVPHEER